jgi:methylmalonyl-CoA/ethylmalonyl-CoA epimerase
MSIGRKFAQVAWVVRDITVAERFFRDSVGTPPFFKMQGLKAADLAGTYLGEPADFEFHLYLCYSGDTMLELIQPVSGRSIYTDFLERHGGGGVQHVAFMVEESELDGAVADLTGKGHPVITTLTLPVARVAYFDTYSAIGVATEIIGLTEAGHDLIRRLKSGDY